MGTGAWFDLLPRTFQFQHTPRLRDRELELISPDLGLIDDVLAACSHPLTRQQAFDESRVTRSQIVQFLRAAPGGREPADASRGRVPTYHFWMWWHDSPGEAPRPIRIAGGISLRVGMSQAIELYYGHVGYHVFPPARRHHFAERACRMLFPLARQHDLRPLWITCNPDNWASRTTCERLGGKLVEIVPVPCTDPLYARGEHEKCRYRVDLD